MAKRSDSKPPADQTLDNMQIEYVSPATLKPNPNNPRKNEKAVPGVMRSIQEFGFNVPIVVDDDLNVCAGHTRLAAAMRLGLDVVPIVRRAHLKANAFRGFAIADNKTAEASEWDQVRLQHDVIELRDDKDFNIAAIGFDDTELTKILDVAADAPRPGGPSEDDAPDLPAKTKTKRGDIFIMGRHKIICGDATLPETYHRILGDLRIDCVITDPPHGVEYSGPGKQTSSGIEGNSRDLDALRSIIGPSMREIVSVCRDGACVYVCHGITDPGIAEVFETALIQAGVTMSTRLVWIKQVASMGWQDYRERHESIWYGWKGNGHRRVKDRTETSVWEVDRAGNYKHPTQKPVALYVRAMRNSTIREEVVLDAFCGSGSALIACEKMNRRFIGIELDPKFVDVTVERWQEYTGKEAECIRQG